MKELIIIGGPSCAGKTFLIDKLCRGEFPALRGQLGLADPSSWHYLEARNVAETDGGAMRLVLHVDLYAHSVKQDAFACLSDLISRADRVVVLTIHASPKLLMRRMRSRLIKSIGELFCPGTYREKRHSAVARYIGRLWRKQKAYNRGFSTVLYRRWFAFLRAESLSKHWVLESTASETLIAEELNVGAEHRVFGDAVRLTSII